MVDSNVYFREALKITLQDLGNSEIVAQFSSAKEYLNYITYNNADVVFLDTNLFDSKGIDLIKMSMQLNPQLHIIVFSAMEQNCKISQFLAAGACGYLSKCRNNISLLRKIIDNPCDRIFISDGIFTQNSNENNAHQNPTIKENILQIENSNN